MTKFHLERILPYDADQLWQLVGDIENYPRFIPWITGLRAYNHTPMKDGQSRLDADVAVGFKMLSEKFSTRVTRTVTDRSVDITSLQGPFRRMIGRWEFIPVDGGCRIDFDMDMEMKNPILNALFKANFNLAVSRLMACFENRARETLAPVSRDSSPHSPGLA
ncbi:MAG: SRPBCC family protein [Asticcacaulis sp.]